MPVSEDSRVSVHNIDTIIDNEPDMLSQAFEDDAVSRELRAAQIWRENAIFEEQRAYPRFKDETPAREMSFKGLDLTKVPALPDYLLKDPVGLKSFLRSARNIPDAHPMKAVGKSGGPAVMSLGAAIAMFGVPKLGADWPSESTSGQATEETTPLTEAPVPGVTELDMKKSSYGGKALVASVFESDAEQWALFGHTKHLKFVDMLAAHYVRLVAAKEEHVKTVAAKVRAKAAIAKRQVVADQTGKRSEKAAAEPSATTDEALPAIFGGWPDVQELDWISFTNWVQACRRLDKNFGKTALPKWEQERLERFALAKVLDKWDLSAAIANGFDDGCSGSKPPTAYYDKAKTIMEIDAPKAGIDPKTGKARVARRGR